MIMFKSIEIECFDIVIRKEDVEEFRIDILYDERVHKVHDNCFRDTQ